MSDNFFPKIKRQKKNMVLWCLKCCDEKLKPDMLLFWTLNIIHLLSMQLSVQITRGSIPWDEKRETFVGEEPPTTNQQNPGEIPRWHWTEIPVHITWSLCDFVLGNTDSKKKCEKVKLVTCKISLTYICIFLLPSVMVLHSFLSCYQHCVPGSFSQITDF